METCQTKIIKSFVCGDKTVDHGQFNVDTARTCTDCMNILFSNFMVELLMSLFCEIISLTDSNYRSTMI